LGKIEVEISFENKLENYDLAILTRPKKGIKISLTNFKIILKIFQFYSQTPPNLDKK